MYTISMKKEADIRNRLDNSSLRNEGTKFRKSRQTLGDDSTSRSKRRDNCADYINQEDITHLNIKDVLEKTEEEAQKNFLDVDSVHLESIA